ncbi:MAG: hypothetical protein KAJ62_11705 [Desulfobacteraceae bacterium]|nr:hypothetical protein [Desulfobacteraceae bacterium]
MALAKLTPTHMAIQSIDDTIKALKLHKAELIATLPVVKKKPPGPMHITHPITGKKCPVKKRR